MQYIPLLYGYVANEGLHLNRIKKEKLLDEMSVEQLLFRESQKSGRLSSRTDGQMQGAELSSICSRSREDVSKDLVDTSKVDMQLFSSMGLYDLLIQKSAQKEN
uniref:Uncharacterized protein n=1 Tax=Elaeophora elaphi TaxID=1147741 RepID=A0A0R3RP38_9BILA